MNLKQLAAKPQLIKISIDDTETVERYGEALDFYVYDRQSMDTFVKLATITDGEFDKIAGIVSKMILDENAKPIINDDVSLPPDVFMKAIQKTVDCLGKNLTSTTAK